MNLSLSIKNPEPRPRNKNNNDWKPWIEIDIIQTPTDVSYGLIKQPNIKEAYLNWVKNSFDEDIYQYEFKKLHDIDQGRWSVR